MKVSWVILAAFLSVPLPSAALASEHQSSRISEVVRQFAQSGSEAARRQCRNNCDIVRNHCVNVGRPRSTCNDQYNACMNSCY